MSRLRFQISMSLDGFVAGPDQSEADPLGRGGMQRHHHAREPVVKAGGTTFTFVTDGIESALRQARAAAGSEQDVGLSGGADVAQQYLRAGLIDEMVIHLVPVLLGAGARLFENLNGFTPELECTRAVAAPGVTHLCYRAA